MRDDPLLTLHPAQYALGKTNQERGDAYRALLRDALNDEDLAAIRAYMQQQLNYGCDEFRAMVQTKTRCFAGAQPAHRPARVIPQIGK